MAIAFALSLGLQALSAAQSPPTSDAKPAAESATASDAKPAAESATTGDAKPAAAGPAPSASAAIVLVLPLASATFGRAAEAVQAGFLAAAEAAKFEALVIAHGDDDVLAAFAKAKEAGARVIVGPLVRDDLKTVAGAGLDLPPTIALNQLDDGATLPDTMYTLTLTVDSDARQIAHRARDDGAATVAVIVSDTPLQKRFASAFNAEWILAGGGAPVVYRFDRSPEALALLRRELGRSPFESALLAVDGADMALAKSYVKSIPTYAGNQVNDRPPRQMLRDLDNLRFVEIPWLVDPEAPAFADLKRPTYPNASLDRLYALGIDAFRVARAFTDGRPEKFALDGATGRLSLDPLRQFIREGRIMQFRAGQIEPVEVR